MKKFLHFSIIIFFTFYLASCSAMHITYSQTQEWKQTTVQDSSGKKEIQETKQNNIQGMIKIEL